MKIKYPRTKHLPWSQGITSDDKVLKDTKCFAGKSVVVTEKMDGENSTLTRDYYHARSLDSKDHESRSWIKQFHAYIKCEIPIGWRICGENLFAKHSIKYDNLRSYFYCFSIWDDNNDCLSWNDTVEVCTILGIDIVPILYRGIYNDNIKNIIKIDESINEGYVIRNDSKFNYNTFNENVGKFVRANHVQCNEHWMHTTIIKNELIKNPVK